MDYDRLNVLVVSGGGYQGLSVIKGLRCSESVRVVMVDSAEENICKYFVDSFYQVPGVDDPEEFINAVLKICRDEDIKIIFPSTELELSVLAENREMFKENGVYVAVSAYEILNTLRDKRTLYKFLRQKGFPTLPLLDISQETTQYPVLGKPVRGWGSKGTVILNSSGEAAKYQPSENDYVWQPYLEDFDEYSVDCAINFDGVVSDIIIRQRLQTISGFSSISELAHDPAMEGLVRGLLDSIVPEGACGIFNIQLLKTDSGYFFSDVNPRIGTSAVFSYNMGVNYPLFMCSYINPEIYRSPQDDGAKHLKMVRYLEEHWIEKIDRSEIKAIVFDLDDTLINQKLWIAEKLKILRSKFNSRLPGEFLLTAVRIVEEGNRSKLFCALAEELSFSDDFKKQLIEDYRRIEPPHLPLFPDALPVITQLKKLGLKLALLTDNPPISQKQKVKVGRLEDIFDEIVYSRESGGEKPGRAAFDELTKRLDVPAQSLVMVGDNLYKDIMGSLESGYRYAYWVVREGTFFNFDQGLFDGISDVKNNYRKIRSLRELLWDLI